MFKNFDKVIATAAETMEDNAIAIDIEKYKDTLPKGINYADAVAVADHLKRYTTETATEFVNVSSDFKEGDYTFHAETPFGTVEHALTSSNEGYELTISNSVDMSEYKETLDALYAKVGLMELESEINEDEE